MRKPRGVQIRANRLIGPGKCLVGTIDECPPRGEVAATEVQRPTEAAAITEDVNNFETLL